MLPAIWYRDRMGEHAMTAMIDQIDIAGLLLIPKGWRPDGS